MGTYNVGSFIKRLRCIADNSSVNSAMDSRWLTGGFKGTNTVGYGKVSSPNSTKLTDPADFKRLASYGYNLFRVGCGFTESSPASFNYSLSSVVEDYVDFVIEQARANGVNVVIVFGLDGSEGATSNHWNQPLATSTCTTIFQYLANKYKNNTTVVGFDLMNEPVITGGAVDNDWNILANTWARAIRAVDSNRTIIVEPTSYASRNKLSVLSPLIMENVVYSIHFYTPIDFTHQGTGTNPTPPTNGNVYPGYNDGTNPLWTQATISSTLQVVRNFKAAYNVPIYVGEFSCDIYANADGRYNLLKDYLDIFAAEKWNWSFFGDGTWFGWDLRYQKVDNLGELIDVPDNRLVNLIKNYIR